MSHKRKRDEYPLRNRKRKVLKWGSLSIDILSVVTKFLRPEEYRAVLLTCLQWSHVEKKQLIPHFYRNHFGEVNNITPDEMKKRFYYRRNIIQQKKSVLIYEADDQPRCHMNDVAIHIVMDDEKTFLYKPHWQYLKLIHNEKVKKFKLEHCNDIFMSFNFNRDYIAGIDAGALKIWNNDGRLLWGHDSLVYYPWCDERLGIWQSDVCYDDNSIIKVCDIRSGARRDICDLSFINKLLFRDNKIYGLGQQMIKIYDLRKTDEPVFFKPVTNISDFCFSHDKVYASCGDVIKVFDGNEFIDIGIKQNDYQRIIGCDDMLICESRRDNNHKLNFIDVPNKNIYHQMEVSNMDSIACGNSKIAYSYQEIKERTRRRMVQILDFS